MINNVSNDFNYSNDVTRDEIHRNIGLDSKIFEDLLRKLEEGKARKDNYDYEEEDGTPFSFKSGNIYGGQTTDRGTKIVNPGEDMDKNAFLRILAAQMANQNPTNPQDGTEYVSQFAQFASMEQMSNLNTTMSGFASQSLIGKGVMLNAYNSHGDIITGIVRSVAQSGSKISIGVEYLNDSNELVMGEFENNDILNVIEVTDSRLDYINNNMSVLVGSSMIGKDVEFMIENDPTENDVEYGTVKGKVEGVIVDRSEVSLKVRVNGTDEIEVIKLEKITKIK